MEEKEIKIYYHKCFWCDTEWWTEHEIDWCYKCERQSSGKESEE
jgi:hypothetical protein